MNPALPPQNGDDEQLRLLLVQAYVYRDINENVNDLTLQIEKLLKKHIITPDRFRQLFKLRSEFTTFYSSLTLYELKQLGF
jgi:hypothetical protein